MNPPSTRIPPAAFRFRNQQQQSSCAGASQTLAQEQSRRARSLLIRAALWAPSMAERDIILEALAEFPDPSETTPSRWPWAGSSRIPAVANAAGRAAPRNWTAAAATVMDIKFNGASVSRNDRPSASYQFPATTSLFHITFLTILLSNSSTAPSLSKPSDLLLPQPCGMTAPALMAGHCRCASTLSRGFELKYNEKKSSSGTGSSQREEACSMPAESAGSDDKRSVLPRGSVLQQNVTKLAAIVTRSIAVQTEDPACGGISLWDWLTPTAVTSTATQTTDPAADGRSLHRWPSIQGQYWLELQKVQHDIQHTLEKCRDPGRKPRACSPTAMLEQTKERIRNISQDMHILSKSCGKELVRSSLARARRPAPKKRRRAQRKRVRPFKQACSDTIEETISSTDAAVAQRKRPRFDKGSSPCPITHTMTDTSLHLTTPPPSDPTTASGSRQTTVMNPVSPRRRVLC